MVRRVFLVLWVFFLASAWSLAGERAFVPAGGGVFATGGNFQVYLLDFPETAREVLDRANDFRARAGEFLDRSDLPPAVREALSVLEIQPSLSWNEALAEAAAVHARDMLERGYFAHVSPEGLGPMDRALSAGYPAAFVGESLAALVFESPISPEEALDILWRKLSEDALSGQSPEGAPLVFPFYRAVGAGLASGEISFGGRLYYAYVLDILWAIPDNNTPKGVMVARAPFELLPEASLRIFPDGPRLRFPYFKDGSFFFIFSPATEEIYQLKIGEELYYIVDPSQAIVINFGGPAGG